LYNSNSCSGNAIEYTITSSTQCDPFTGSLQTCNSTSLNFYNCSGSSVCSTSCPFFGFGFIEGCVTYSGQAVSETCVTDTSSISIPGGVVTKQYNNGDCSGDAYMISGFASGSCFEGLSFSCYGNSVTETFCSATDCSSGCTSLSVSSGSCLGSGNSSFVYTCSDAMRNAKISFVAPVLGLFAILFQF